MCRKFIIQWFNGAKSPVGGSTSPPTEGLCPSPLLRYLSFSSSSNMQTWRWYPFNNWSIWAARVPNLVVCASMGFEPGALTVRPSTSPLSLGVCVCACARVRAPHFLFPRFYWLVLLLCQPSHWSSEWFIQRVEVGCLTIRIFAASAS